LKWFIYNAICDPSSNLGDPTTKILILFVTRVTNTNTFGDLSLWQIGLKGI
jgi:hypothetical protein